MRFLSLLYLYVTKIRNYLYDRYILKVKKIDGVKVVCIGNITVGGTGKTPAVQYFAKKYVDLGYKVAIISRGYKGKRKKDPFLVRDYNEIYGTSHEAGDEAYLHSTKLKLPVIVSKNRHEGTLLAKKVYGIDLVVLDDGFQHRQLWRDKDIVLIDATDPFGSKELLPKGRLREELSGLNRAKEFIITKTDLVDEEKLNTIVEELKAYDKPISKARHVPVELYNSAGKKLKLEKVKNKKVLLFSGLANPDQFKATIEKLLPKEIETLDFEDHHKYTKADFTLINKSILEFKPDLIISTEKDLVKYGKELNFKNLYTLSIEFQVLEDNICWDF